MIASGLRLLLAMVCLSGLSCERPSPKSAEAEFLESLETLEQIVDLLDKIDHSTDFFALQDEFIPLAEKMQAIRNRQVKYTQGIEQILIKKYQTRLQEAWKNLNRQYRRLRVILDHPRFFWLVEDWLDRTIYGIPTQE